MAITAPAATPTTGRALTRPSEDAAVKSIKRLLWLLWGLGWVIVPLIVRQLGVSKDTIPLAMFGALACVFIVTWHKGAVIRALLRSALGEQASAATPSPRARVEAAPPRHRVDVVDANKVRVHAEDFAPGEALGRTEIPVGETERGVSAARAGRGRAAP